MVYHRPIIVERLEAKLAQFLRRPRSDRPFITVAFAQSLDASITHRPEARMQLSNRQSMSLTHQLRARHDAILVGVNTVRIDDPLLTVRLVSGASPRPIVLDSRLRISEKARLLVTCREPIVATTCRAFPRKRCRLQDAGVCVVELPAAVDGLVALPPLLAYLRSVGIRSLMIEGGARVITSFLTAGLADQLVLTICPLLVNGPRALTPANGFPHPLPQLRNVCYEALDDDLVLMADLK
jgi:3,4-dihydroxy 2-butanone 4-phosphate synthase/GTP cyclohydrolase II